MAKSNRTVKLDMTGVESYTRCPEGEHVARTKKIEMGTVQGSGDDCLKAVFEIIKGEAKGCQVFETFSLSEKALWKLKSYLTAIGIKADGKLKLDLDKLEGKVCIIDVVHEEYNNQKRAKISAYLKQSSSDGDDDEDEDDDDDEDDEDDEEDEELAPKSKKSAAKKPAPAKKGNKPAEDDDEEDDDEDEDEDEPAPKKSSKKSSKKANPAKKAAKKRPDPDEDKDDDDDWEEDEE